MKIEILESLAATWLKHIKNCQIVQNNWTPSASWPTCNINLINNLYIEAQNMFGQDFKLKCKLDQFISQAEIDVVGLHLCNNQNSDCNNNKKLYLIDTAFHSNGLGYGNAQENVNRIIKKCLRAEICNLAYFNISDVEIIFITPKINNSTSSLLNNKINDLNSLFAKFNLNINVKIIADDDFNNEILQPTLNIINQTNDNELFARSIILYLMFYQNNKKISSIKASQQINALNISVNPLIFIANIANFEIFLTSKYAKNTVKSYINAILSVMRIENITFDDLFNNISSIKSDYSLTGCKATLGNRGHGTWRNALARLEDFKSYLMNQNIQLTNTLTANPVDSEDDDTTISNIDDID